VPAAFLGAWVLGRCWVDRWSRRGLQAFAQAITVLLVLATGASIGVISDVRGQYDNTDIARGPDALATRAREVSALLALPHRQTIAPPSRYVAPLMPFFAYLDRCTAATDRLIVTGEFPEIPVLAGRPFAGDGVVFGSWYSSTIHQRRTVERMRSRPPLFALYVGDDDAFRARFADVEAFLRQAYVPLADVPVDEGGTVRIVVLARRRAMGVDSPTGWPCFRAAPPV
jgi:hypothetical protein